MIDNTKPFQWHRKWLSNHASAERHDAEWVDPTVLSGNIFYGTRAISDNEMHVAALIWD